ncbi:hypothetical protein BDV32DRAFT_117051 [Aspergillus pseudonomiae]|nr:hypothetical protein BDV32DRAFT_117051 [Aspergillus pseudonomiae]
MFSRWWFLNEIDCMAICSSMFACMLSASGTKAEAPEFLVCRAFFNEYGLLILPDEA